MYQNSGQHRGSVCTVLRTHNYSIRTVLYVTVLRTCRVTCRNGRRTREIKPPSTYWAKAWPCNAGKITTADKWIMDAVQQIIFSTSIQSLIRSFCCSCAPEERAPCSVPSRLFACGYTYSVLYTTFAHIQYYTLYTPLLTALIRADTLCPQAYQNITIQSTEYNQQHITYHTNSLEARSKSKISLLFIRQSPYKQNSIMINEKNPTYIPDRVTPYYKAGITPSNPSVHQSISSFHRVWVQLQQQQGRSRSSQPRQ